MIHVAGLYQFNGINEASNPRLQCLEDDGFGPQIANGIKVEGTDPAVIYMAEIFDKFLIYQTRTSPTFGLDYQGNGGIPRANMARGYGVDPDESSGLMAVARDGNLMMYDIGYGTGTPTSPVLMSTTDLAIQTSANAVALQYPVVHVSQQYSAAPPETLDVTDPLSPVPLDQQFWGLIHPWNSLGECLWGQQVHFSDDAEAMYFLPFHVHLYPLSSL